MPTDPTELERHRAFGGEQLRLEHPSRVLDCRMTCSVYLPPAAARSGPVPVVYWLSGLTCTDENFTHKAGAQRYAAELGLALVAPDTSPRGLGIPGEDDSYDLGTGAGFYLDATAAPWAGRWNMQRYIIEELPGVLEPALGLDGARRAVSGHSMGGHGALILALRHPAHFTSVSAFAPIAAPSEVPWGRKAFEAYLGDDSEAWRQWDSCALLTAGARFPGDRPVLVDQGDADPFLAEQLRPERLAEVAGEQDVAVDLRMQPGYDHSYYFVASFIGEHLRHHASFLASR